VLTDIESRRAALAARTPTWTPRTLDGFLEAVADEHPDRPLVVTDDKTVTYAEVAEWSRRLADGLAALGAGPGRRVGLLMANHLEFVPLKFAIARTGAAAIPFNFLYREEELAYVLRQSRCELLLTMSSFAGLNHLGMLARIGALPDLRHVVVLPAPGDVVPDGMLDVEGLAALGDEHRGASDAAGAAPDDLGDILFTSGTTGSPKGVMVTHDAVLRTAYASALTCAFEDGRRILFSLPCYHMFGYVEGLLAAMVVGGAIVPRTAFSPADYVDAIEQHRPSEVLCVPTMTVALLEHPDLASRDLSSVVALLSGAAPAPARLWQRMQEELGIPECTTGYGMTECGGAMTMTLPEDPIERHVETVGRPKLAGVAGLADAAGALCTYATVDPLSGEPLTGGGEGELVSTGPTHMLGFWDKPEETALALRGGWVHSGDLGVVGADGYLQLTGRAKELYKSGGELVMPKEVEELLTSQPGVSQAFAVGVPDDRWGEVGYAWVVADPGAELDPEALRELCRARLARFKVPKHVLLIAADELPTTPTGKVQKFRLVKRAVEALAADG